MAALNEKECCVRELYWEEMKDERRIQELCAAVEILWKRVKDLEQENRTLKDHQHIGDKLYIPAPRADNFHVNDFVPYQYDFIRHAPRPLPEVGKREV